MSSTLRCASVVASRNRARTARPRPARRRVRAPTSTRSRLWRQETVSTRRCAAHSKSPSGGSITTRSLATTETTNVRGTRAPESSTRSRSPGSPRRQPTTPWRTRHVHDLGPEQLVDPDHGVVLDARRREHDAVQALGCFASGDALEGDDEPCLMRSRAITTSGPRSLTASRPAASRSTRSLQRSTSDLALQPVSPDDSPDFERGRSSDTVSRRCRRRS